ncbi:MAG: ATP synthase complex assembly protein atp12 [Icmadophila ericetorum]|nr:ATP synthase complex assembly protein atp12 [Icmadophila ericetorum]
MSGNHIYRTSLRTIPIRCSSHNLRCLHISAPKAAKILPITAAGPPPLPPRPAASHYGEKVERRRRQAELLKRGQEMKAELKPGNAIKKRFWKDVSVKTEEDGTHTVHLDARPVRSPPSKSVLPIPSSKLHLATAIALEWDLLASAQQALKQHLIPLTSMASRAHDISLQDQGKAPGNARQEIVQVLMRYLDTDTLLCWAPAKSHHDAMQLEESEHRKEESLRDIQIRTTQPIVSYLTNYIWPGIEIQPVLDDGSIVPKSQPQQTKDVIRGWISGLGAWELAGLERAVLAGKSLCVGARLVVEWSENHADVRNAIPKEQWTPKFGIEEAAEACSLELRWQTAMWGEVEDTHDVDREDVKRQFGSVIMLVSGRN